MYVDREDAVASHAAEGSMASPVEPVRPTGLTMPDKSSSQTGPFYITRRPTVTVNKGRLAVDTLLHYDIPFEVDQRKPDTITIMRDVKADEMKVLLEHTRRLRSRLAIEGHGRVETKRTTSSRPASTGVVFTTERSSMIDVMRYRQRPREPAVVIASTSSRHRPSASPGPVRRLRRRTSALIMQDVRNDNRDSKEELDHKAVARSHSSMSPDQHVQGGPESSLVLKGEGLAYVQRKTSPQKLESAQTIFIYKLQEMLEDPSIRHLISWSDTNDSFNLSPSAGFAQVLSNYFQHTNISTFIHQLNTNGFYCVRSASQDKSTGSPSREFRHTSGKFNRSNLAGTHKKKFHLETPSPIGFTLGTVDASKAEDAQGQDPEYTLKRWIVKPSGSKPGPSARRGAENTHHDSKILSSPNDYSLPELGNLIAGWQATLSHNGSEKDLNSQKETKGTLLQPLPMDRLSHEPNEKSLPVMKDATVSCDSSDDDTCSIHTTRTSPTGNPKLLAVVGDAVKRLVTPNTGPHKIKYAEADRDTPKDTRPYVVESQHTVRERDQSTIDEDSDFELPSAPLSECDFSGGVPIYERINRSTTSSAGTEYSSSCPDIDTASLCASDANCTRESLLSSRGSDYGSDLGPASRGNVDIQNALDSAMDVVKRLLLQKLVGDALSETTDAVINHGSSNEATGNHRDTATLSTQPSQSVTRRNGGKRARGGGRDPGDEGGDDSDEDDNDRPKKKGLHHGMPQEKLKCPFYQRHPERYTRASCRGEGFDGMAKLKDHLRRVHIDKWRCARCQAEFAEEEDLDAHKDQDGQCERRPEQPDDRISPKMFRNLNFKKAPFAKAKSTEEKWRCLYEILFPNDPKDGIPSPYHRNTFTPELADALSQAIEDELTEELAQVIGPIMSSIKARIPAIVERCRKKLATPPINVDREADVRTPGPESSRVNDVAAEQSTSRNKKPESSPRATRDASTSLRPIMTVNAARKMQQHHPTVPQMTPSGSSEGSDEPLPLSASASVDNMNGISTQLQGQSATIVGVGDWNHYENSSVPFDPSQTAMLDFELPTTYPEVEGQIPLLRPLQNNPHIYGGSAPFNVSGTPNWHSVGTINNGKGAQALPPMTQEPIFDEQGLANPSNNWQYAEDEFPQWEPGV